MSTRGSPYNCSCNSFFISSIGEAIVAAATRTLIFGTVSLFGQSNFCSAFFRLSAPFFTECFLCWITACVDCSVAFFLRICYSCSKSSYLSLLVHWDTLIFVVNFQAFSSLYLHYILPLLDHSLCSLLCCFLLFLSINSEYSRLECSDCFC